MAEDQDPSGPSLEPPSLFRRKKKAPAEPPAAAPAASAPAAPTAPADDSPTTILDDVGPVALTPGPKPTAPPLFADEAPAPAPPPASSDPDGSSEAPRSSPMGSLDAPARPPRPPREGPPVPGRVAAVLAGLVAAAVIVGLTKASFSLCEWIQGTDSCGGPGFFLLLAILVLAVVLGSLTLRLCGVAESGTTSFLAVGLTSVIALLFLVDQLFDWWMVIAIPLVSVATFLLSYWVTTTFVDTEPEAVLAAEPEAVDHDVR